MDRKKFGDLVDTAYEKIPQKFRDKIDNVAIMVEDYPSAEDLEKLKIRGKACCLGFIEELRYIREAFGRGSDCPMK